MNSNVEDYDDEDLAGVTLADFELVQNENKEQSLGKGSFGVVQKVKRKGTEKIFALKNMRKDTVIEGNLVDQVELEITVQAKLIHPNVLRLYKHFQNDDTVFLLLEYCAKGELYQLLRTQRLRRFSEEMACKFFCQAGEGLMYLHKQNVMHRDIKPENLLVTEDDVLKIADFGWCAQSDELRTTFCGTLDYLAPEMIQGKGHDHTLDVWSAGVLLYEMVVGRPPFQSTNHTQLITKILKLELSFPNFVSEDLKKLVRSLLVREPQQRLPLKDALRHDWVRMFSQSPVPTEKIQKVQPSVQVQPSGYNFSPPVAEINSNDLCRRAIAQITQQPIAQITQQPTSAQTTQQASPRRYSQEKPASPENTEVKANRVGGARSARPEEEPAPPRELTQPEEEPAAPRSRSFEGKVVPTAPSTVAPTATNAIITTAPQPPCPTTPALLTRGLQSPRVPQAPYLVQQAPVTHAPGGVFTGRIPPGVNQYGGFSPVSTPVTITRSVAQDAQLQFITGNSSTAPPAVVSKEPELVVETMPSNRRVANLVPASTSGFDPYQAQRPHPSALRPASRPPAVQSNMPETVYHPQATAAALRSPGPQRPPGGTATAGGRILEPPGTPNRRDHAREPIRSHTLSPPSHVRPLADGRLMPHSTATGHRDIDGGNSAAIEQAIRQNINRGASPNTNRGATAGQAARRAGRSQEKTQPGFNHASSQQALQKEETGAPVAHERATRSDPLPSSPKPQARRLSAAHQPTITRAGASPLQSCRGMYGGPAKTNAEILVSPLQMQKNKRTGGRIENADVSMLSSGTDCHNMSKFSDTQLNISLADTDRADAEAAEFPSARTNRGPPVHRPMSNMVPPRNPYKSPASAPSALQRQAMAAGLVQGPSIYSQAQPRFAGAPGSTAGRPGGYMPMPYAGGRPFSFPSR